jgi:hypothetical protein
MALEDRLEKIEATLRSITSVPQIADMIAKHQKELADAQVKAREAAEKEAADKAAADAKAADPNKAAETHDETSRSIAGSRSKKE